MYNIYELYQNDDPEPGMNNHVPISRTCVPQREKLFIRILNISSGLISGCKLMCVHCVIMYYNTTNTTKQLSLDSLH